MPSCKQIIFDNLDSCERGIFVNLYDQTECSDTPRFPQVPNIHLYAFDLQDRLVATTVIQNPQLFPGKEFFIPIATPGLYSVIAWAGLHNDLYDTTPMIVGKTDRKDLFLKLKEQNSQVRNLTGHRLWVGCSPIVEIGKENSLYAHTRANIREITNRIEVTVEGLDAPEQYIIAIRSANGSYSLNGEILPDIELNYPTQTYIPKDSTLAANFTTLKLQNGRKSSLIIRNIKTQKVLFIEDLVGVILLSPSKDNLNLRCLNDYHVRLRVRRCPRISDTYTVTSIWINDWLVHSYDIEFS